MKSRKENQLKYDINDPMPLVPLIMYGLQWFLIIIPVVLIIGSIVGNFQFGNIADTVFYSQKIFILMGIGLIVQIFWGHRLPVVLGPATVLLIGILSSQTNELSAIYTGIILGGALIFLVSYTKMQKWMQKIFTTRIIIVILALIAMTLAPTIIQLFFADTNHLFFALLFGLSLTTLMLVFNRVLNGVWKSTIVLWAMIIGSVVYRILSPEMQAETIATESAISQSIFIFPLKFDIGLMISFFFCYIALFVNELGSIRAVGHALNADNIDNRTSRGLRTTGLMNMVSGLFGVVGPVDFSLSPGVIMSTGCASRYPLVVTGLVLIICGLFAPLIEFLAAIPKPVLGIVLLYLMTTQLGSSFKLMQDEKAISTFNHAITIAFPLMVALLVAFMPAELNQEIPGLLRPILCNGFVMGVIAVLIVEHIIFKEKK